MASERKESMNELDGTQLKEADATLLQGLKSAALWLGAGAPTSSRVTSAGSQAEERDDICIGAADRGRVRRIRLVPSKPIAIVSIDMCDNGPCATSTSCAAILESVPNRADFLGELQNRFSVNMARSLQR